MMEMNQPVLRSTPSQCLPGLIPYQFGAVSNLRFNQLWSGMSWGTTNPDSFIFSLSPRFGRTSSGCFFCTMSKRYVKLVLNSLISTTKNKQVNYLPSPNVPWDHHLLFSPSAFCRVQDHLCKQRTQMLFIFIFW